MAREKKKKEPEEPFPIVGIGASAGGLETLEAFFDHMPGDARVAFVVVQHLSPKHKSVMAELLAKHTQMCVRQIEDGLRLAPGCIFLNPPDKNVSLFNHTLHLMELAVGRGINMPIDFFFRSLAEDQKEHAIGIVLSGTASDGTLGLQAIKGEGGMAMVQDPATAKYDGMPRNAIETGLIDFILPVETMPQALLAYVQHPFSHVTESGPAARTDERQQYNKIAALIRSATGHDFSQYKPNTVRRRIERRLAVHHLDKLSDYALYLQKNPAETQALFKDLLIGVTRFFRDPEAFAALAAKGLDALVGAKTKGQTLRCWVVGCANGEEAYSVAILIVEAMEKHDKLLDAQVFATDIDAQAIETARKGAYPESIATDLSKARLQRWFIKADGMFKVKKQLREMVVFSPQSVIKDPPFSRLDLVSCRNLLIYMEPSLQQKIIPLLHYALNPEGLLFLGSAETIGDFTDLFTTLDSRQRIYRHKPWNSQKLIEYPARRALPPAAAQDVRRGPAKPPPLDYQALAEKMILDQFAPAGVLIDDKHEILHFVGRTEKFLVPPTGRPSFNVLSMAHPDLKIVLTAALHQATRERTHAVRKAIRLAANGRVLTLDLSVTPLSVKPADPGLWLVLFHERADVPATDEAHPEGAPPQSEDNLVQQLEEELKSTREHLQATIEELETSNEELKSTNEELQSVNEEMQSTNEEMETSKEELQSTNEELNTVNAELQDKVQALSRAGDDMHNLLAATDIASVFLDTRLCIKRFTPAAARIIKLIPADIGRPLSDLKTSFPQIDLLPLTQRVLDDLNTLEMQIVSEDYAHFQLKIIPYRTIDNVIDGLVVTLINIQKQVSGLRRLASVLEDANDAITVQDFKGRILAWNKGAVRMYGYTEFEALQMNIDDLIPAERRRENGTLRESILKGDTVRSFKTQRKTKDGEILDIWLTGTALTDMRGRPIELATTERNLAWLTTDPKERP
jgi:two-component system CheB/CheR fusion protein